MKRFLIKIGIFFLALSAITVIVNTAYIRLDRSDPDYTEKFQRIPSSIRICNFGSSHGLYDFNYEKLEDAACFNFGLQAQLPSYDERLFEYYQDFLSEGAVVFIPVSYFSLFGLDEREEEGFAEKNRRYYRILPDYLIKDYDFKTDIYMNWFPSLLAGRKLFTVLSGRSENTNAAEWERTITPEEAAADAVRAGQKHLMQNKLDASGNRIVNEEETDALISLIRACYDRKLNPVLVTTPYLKDYTAWITENAPGFYEEFYALIEKITDETGVPYFDYAFDERFSDRYDWFINADHMNREGAGYFVDVLMEEAAGSNGREAGTGR